MGSPMVVAGPHFTCNSMLHCAFHVSCNVPAVCLVRVYWLYKTNALCPLRSFPHPPFVDSYSERGIPCVLRSCSIGSLGRDGQTSCVSDITVTSSHLNNTTNGLRIKTWQGGKGHVTGVKFNDVTFNNVDMPIILDQVRAPSLATILRQEDWENVKLNERSSVPGTCLDYDCSVHSLCMHCH